MKQLTSHLKRWTPFLHTFEMVSGTLDGSNLVGRRTAKLSVVDKTKRPAACNRTVTATFTPTSCPSVKAEDLQHLEIESDQTL
jgi:Asp/Glu/hydantoin racemase